ncbi:MAG: NADH-quinone oxidoreductase subunit NuoK [Gammaproteobacteria bacterium]|jgi:NADH-quinone oxidoreductase subunit K|nr:NADH-quinone oxidoreductase subunit NuoK [Gammaproteobacteria bacterium]MBT4462959.1 NADH-quinone oxidoreductase subunit NuoK [Gammaproteobacteria bacterium]MBT4654618.1 NADH-quinone oxidoreductase subunit NuoK [Gammaproteobacteria bacterium]MBT5761304.1 NADH-quinone oxidoreductase subunit NuoK [Gammaproteobacteria bacterium]MBT6331870.1 NADH-quinone oxidoreductase subunit NuoK [Gammaproteobacteria bacterium]
MIPMSHYLILSSILFSISLAGIFLNRKNIIIMLMSLELMFLSINFNFIIFGNYLSDLTGQIFVFFILAVVAAESAIGLAIIVVLFRNKQGINVQDIARLKG